jgi:hypothetical protein
VDTNDATIQTYAFVCSTFEFATLRIHTVVKANKDVATMNFMGLTQTPTSRITLSSLNDHIKVHTHATSMNNP